VPAIAYLSNHPSQELLRLVRRYAHTAIFIPDNDSGLSAADTEANERRRSWLAWVARGIGLGWTRVRLRCKDPAELLAHPAEFARVREIVRDASVFGGGGYRGVE
jgi:hypothetical protein